ncbi:MAG: hypothetical protein CVV02_07775 [Firmicutes bacterium HGW-Firmicutes-7]|nr:MAG: hypothetical protein CVV02_07775 [Firmicutes bacterium HGW-Firmicutes-7]
MFKHIQSIKLKHEGNCKMEFNIPQKTKACILMILGKFEIQLVDVTDSGYQEDERVHRNVILLI